VQKQKPNRDHSGPPETVADLGEFGFIANLRRRLPPASGALKLGVGDDAAWWQPASGSGILTTTDMLVAGVHFDLNYTSAADLGYKSLAVNLSDLAAMGAQPACAYLSLALPAELKKVWLDEYIAAFLGLAEKYEVQLAGGDTVAAAELVISVTLNGLVHALASENKPVLRSGAEIGDDIYVSGTVGDSFLGLQLLQGNLKSSTIDASAINFLHCRHRRPTPRVELGSLLAASGKVNAMLDISDGVVADLGHLLMASGALGAELNLAAIPLSRPAFVLVTAGLTDYRNLLTGGEDYELLFTANPAVRSKIAEIAVTAEVALTRIGRITDTGKIFMSVNGVTEELSGRSGYDHFQD
jgi:thiamine-monophosphate kinase